MGSLQYHPDCCLRPQSWRAPGGCCCLHSDPYADVHTHIYIYTHTHVPDAYESLCVCVCAGVRDMWFR